MTTNPSDLEFMRRAVRLAGNGFPAPNPRVGCVLVAGGQVVGEGWHRAAGTPHAEANALAEAGERARGATAYVTLEPCHHHGRTPPCSLALAQAGVARVVFAVPDPNPKAQGGAAFLRAQGIEVVEGVLRAEAEAANRVWLTAVRRGRPYVCAKAAVTADGFMARLDGSSKWITGESARAEGHRLRAEMGAVLVGWQTVVRDEARLTARVAGVERPVTRIVLDPHGHLTGQEPLFAEPGDVHVLRAEPGEPLPWTGVQILQGLWQHGVTSVLVEGGPRTLATFLAEGLVDELHLFLAPTEFGEGIPWNPAGVPLPPVLEESMFPPDKRLLYRW